MIEQLRRLIHRKELQAAKERHPAGRRRDTEDVVRVLKASGSYISESHFGRFA